MTGIRVRARPAARVARNVATARAANAATRAVASTTTAGVGKRTPALARSWGAASATHGTAEHQPGDRGGADEPQLLSADRATQFSRGRAHREQRRELERAAALCDVERRGHPRDHQGEPGDRGGRVHADRERGRLLVETRLDRRSRRGVDDAVAAGLQFRGRIGVHRPGLDGHRRRFRCGAQHVLEGGLRDHDERRGRRDPGECVWDRDRPDRHANIGDQQRRRGRIDGVRDERRQGLRRRLDPGDLDAGQRRDGVAPPAAARFQRAAGAGVREGRPSVERQRCAVRGHVGEPEHRSVGHQLAERARVDRDRQKPARAREIQRVRARARHDRQRGRRRDRAVRIGHGGSHVEGAEVRRRGHPERQIAGPVGERRTRRRRAQVLHQGPEGRVRKVAAPPRAAFERPGIDPEAFGPGGQGRVHGARNEPGHGGRPRGQRTDGPPGPLPDVADPSRAGERLRGVAVRSLGGGSEGRRHDEQTDGKHHQQRSREGRVARARQSATGEVGRQPPGPTHRRVERARRPRQQPDNQERDAEDQERGSEQQERLHRGSAVHDGRCCGLP